MARDAASRRARGSVGPSPAAAQCLAAACERPVAAAARGTSGLATLAPIPCSMISKAFQGRKGRAYLFSDV